MLVSENRTLFAPWLSITLFVRIDLHAQAELPGWLAGGAALDLKGFEFAKAGFIIPVTGNAVAHGRADMNPLKL